MNSIFKWLYFNLLCLVGGVSIETLQAAIHVSEKSIRKIFVKKFLQPMCVVEEGHVGSLDGTLRFVDVSDIFSGGIGSEIVRWQLIQTGKSTSETNIVVEEVRKDADNGDAFISRIQNCSDDEFNTLFVTQHQIIDICRNPPKKILEKSSSTRFLIKKDDTLPTNRENWNDNVFLVIVNAENGVLSVGARKFSTEAIRYTTVFVRPA